MCASESLPAASSKGLLRNRLSGRQNLTSWCLGSLLLGLMCLSPPPPPTRARNLLLARETAAAERRKRISRAVHSLRPHPEQCLHLGQPGRAVLLVFSKLPFVPTCGFGILPAQGQLPPCPHKRVLTGSQCSTQRPTEETWRGQARLLCLSGLGAVGVCVRHLLPSEA